MNDTFIYAIADDLRASGRLAEAEYLTDVWEMFQAGIDRNDDGWLCTCAMECLPLDPKILLKRRKAA
jgi:hypothetical protein